MPLCRFTVFMMPLLSVCVQPNCSSSLTVVFCIFCASDYIFMHFAVFHSNSDQNVFKGSVGIDLYIGDFGETLRHYDDSPGLKAAAAAAVAESLFGSRILFPALNRHARLTLAARRHKFFWQLYWHRARIQQESKCSMKNSQPEGLFS